MGIICSCCSTTDVHKYTKMSTKYKGSKVGMKRNWTSDALSSSAKKMKMAPAKKTVNSMVKEAILRLAEKKEQQYTVNTVILPYNATGWAATGLRPITPQVSGINIIGGTGQADRVGNKIRTRKVTLDLQMIPKPYNVTTNPTPQPGEVIVWIVGLKESNILPNNLDDFFQNGNTTTDPNGSMVDIVKTYNTDKWIVYKRVVRKLGFGVYGGSGGTIGAQYYNNNDYKMNHTLRIDCTKYCPASVVYDDTGNPTTKAVFVAIEWVPSDGGQLNASYVPASMYYNLNYEYTDM